MAEKNNSNVWDAVGQAGNIIAGVDTLFDISGNQRRANRLADRQAKLADELTKPYERFAPEVYQAIAQDVGFSTDRRNADQRAKQSHFDNIISGLGSGNSAKQRLAREIMRREGISDQEVSEYQKATSPEFDPNYNPYRDLRNELYAPDAVSARGAKYFDPSQLTGEFASYEDTARQTYDRGANASIADYIGRGFTSSDTGLMSALVANRNEQSRTNTNFRNARTSELADARRSYEIGQESAGQALLGAGAQEVRAGRRGLAGDLSSNLGMALGHMGGLERMYASNAQQGAGSLGAIISSAAQYFQDPRKKVRRPGSGGSFEGSQALVPKYTPVPKTIKLPPVDRT